jgi:DNA-binding transcriptional MerR regulator
LDGYCRDGRGPRITPRGQGPHTHRYRGQDVIDWMERERQELERRRRQDQERQRRRYQKERQDLACRTGRPGRIRQADPTGARDFKSAPALLASPQTDTGGRHRPALAREYERQSGDHPGPQVAERDVRRDRVSDIIPDRAYSSAEAAILLGLKEHTLRTYRSRSRKSLVGPRFDEGNDGQVIYWGQDLIDWHERQHPLVHAVAPRWLDPDTWYTTRQVAEYLGLTVRALAGLRSRETGPAYTLMEPGRRQVMYRGQDVIDWETASRQPPPTTFAAGRETYAKIALQRRYGRSEAARLLGCNRKTLLYREKKGMAPPVHKDALGRVYYVGRDLLALRQCRAQSSGVDAAGR